MQWLIKTIDQKIRDHTEALSHCEEHPEQVQIHCEAITELTYAKAALLELHPAGLSTPPTYVAHS